MHPELRALVRREHVGFAHDGAAARWVEPPRADVTLMLTLSGTLHEDGRLLADAWVVAPHLRCGVVEMSAGYSCIDVKLTALGAYRILAAPLCEVGGVVGPLDDVVGREAADLAERVADASDWDARFGAVDDFLAARLQRGPAPSRAVAWAVDRLEATGGSTPIGDLAEELGWSRRHFVAMFRQQVGLPPKSVARLLRFEHVLRRIDAAPARWADIAQDCGYFDQSHLNRDFRDLLGTTPTEYVAQRRASEVTFVQDAASTAA